MVVMHSIRFGRTTEKVAGRNDTVVWQARTYITDFFDSIRDAPDFVKTPTNSNLAQQAMGFGGRRPVVQRAACTRGLTWVLGLKKVRRRHMFTLGAVAQGQKGLF